MPNNDENLSVSDLLTVTLEEPVSNNEEVGSPSIGSLLLADEIRKQERLDYRRRNQKRDALGAVGDSLLGAGQGFTGVVGGLASVGLSGAAARVDPTGTQKAGDILRELAVDTSGVTQKVSNYLQDKKTEALQNRTDLSNQEGELDKKQRLEEYNQDISEGQNTFIAGAKRIGGDILDTGGRILSDPMLIGDTTSQALGSLGPSAKLASLGSKVGTELAKTSSNALVKKAAPAAGASVGIGISEASGSYSDASSKVMAMSHEELLNASNEYASLINKGISQKNAKIYIADKTGKSAFTRQLPVATALGLVANKFETAPIKSFKGSSIPETARTVAIQALEEAGQGGSSALNTNLAVRANANRDQDILEDIGDNIATGAIAGVGMSGALASPNLTKEAAKTTGKAALNVTKKVVTNPKVQETTIKAAKSASRSAADILDGAVIAGKKANEVASPVTKPLAEKVIKPSVQATQEKIIKPSVELLDDLANKPNKKIQAETIQNAVSAQETIISKINEENLNQETDKILSALGQDVYSKEVPSTFKDNVPEESTLIQNVTGILLTLADKKTKIKNLSLSDLNYINETITDISKIAKDSSTEIKKDISKIISSPDLMEVKQRIKSIDLNETQTTNEKITPEVVVSSITVAKNNPTNVNPDVANKILEQADQNNLSEEDIRLLKSASKIAQAVNNHREQIVEISNNNRIALSKKPAFQGKEERLPPITKVEKSSRSIEISGFRDRRGKKLRSVNDYAADIFQAIQNPDFKEGDYSFTDSNGNIEDGKLVAEQFGKFVTHMSNKVGALNNSFDNDGKSFGFRSLVGGEIFKNPGEAGSAKAVAYHKNNPNSVKFAQTVYNNAVVAAEVYNTLVETSPELFPQGKLTIPKLKLKEKEIKNEKSTNENTNKDSDISEGNVSEVEDVLSEVLEETKTSNEKELTDQQLENQRIGQEEQLKEILNEKSPEQPSYTEERALDEKEEINDSSLQPTYVYRNVLNTDDILAWAKSQGFPSTLEASELHVTSYYSKAPVDPNLPGTAPRSDEVTVTGGERTVQLFGDNAIVLTLDSVNLQTRYSDAKADGVTSDFSTYKPHITISYAGEGLDLSTITPYQGVIKLGPENQEKIDGSFDTDSLKEVETGSDPKTIETTPEIARNIHPLFDSVYSQREATEIEYTDGGSILGLIEDGPYTAFAKPLMDTLIKGVNRRLETVTISNSDKRTVKELLISKEKLIRKVDGTKYDLIDLPKFKTTAIVDQGTFEYDPQLISLAALAVVDWATSVIPPHPSRLEDTLQKGFNAKLSDVSDEDVDTMNGGVFARQTAEDISKDVLRLWNVSKNKDVPMVDSRGIVEGVVKELITALSENTDLVSLETIKIKNKDHQVIDVSKLRKIQKDMGIQEQNSTRKLLIPDDPKLPSIGQKINSTAQTQSFGDVPLSNLERAALKAIQDTPHYVAEGFSALVSAIGFENMKKLLGYKDLSKYNGNVILEKSIKGRNAGIERNLTEAFLIYNTIIENTKDDERLPVYYPVSISKVGRHQFVGINPQSNKVLRDMITPVEVTLDMETNQDDIDGFWLTVAQASGLNKVENEDHSKILETIQEEFQTKYSEAVDAVLNFIKGGEIDSEVISRVMGNNSGIEALNSVFAVASLRFAQQTGTAASFTTTLAFELDGKTNGSASMMNNFGQGLLSITDYKNFNRVGYFLGRSNKTLNDYFKDGRGDLYVSTAQKAEEILLNKMSLADPTEKQQISAVTRFASQFGEFRITDNGEIEMVRNNAKNPMTKVVYKSGLKGVGDGIADELILKMYESLQYIPDGTKLKDLNDKLKYPHFLDDMEILFKGKLEEGMDFGNIVLSNKSVEYFQNIVKNTIGEALFEAAKETIGAPISDVNDTLVFTSQIQAEFVSKLFDKRFEELVETEKKAGRIESTRDLTQAQYDKLVDGIRVYAPMYSNGSQTLSVGSFSRQAKHNIEMSSNMEGRLRQKSSMLRPEDVKVKIIPYLSIGRGDAMMMNNFYGNTNAPLDTLPIFDGINIPINKIKEYANRANQAVIETWDQDVLLDVVNDFESFLRQVGDEKDILNQVFTEISKKSKNKKPIAYNSEGLLKILQDMQKMNQARTETFQEIPSSVDQMGGSNTSVSRNADKEEMSLSQINQVIQQKLDDINETPVEPPSAYYTELNVTPAKEMIKALLKSLDNSPLRESVKAIRNKIPNDLRVITGSVEQLNTYRQENFPDDGVVITASGVYDTINNIIFIAKNSNETIVHELVHASTFSQVEAHYNGETNAAVDRLEKLMDEFMGLDFSTSPETVQKSIRNARQAILKRQANNDAFSKAAALNEFMAWSLSNELIAKTLKTTRTSLFHHLSKKVIHLMRKLMGNVPNDMFSNIVFNTKLLDNGDNNINNINDGNNNNGGNNGGNGSSDGLTPIAHSYTNFWIDLLQEKVDNLQEATVGRTPKLQQLVRYKSYASDALSKLNFGGFSMTEYERKTFRAIHIILATEMQLDPQTALAMGRIYEHVVTNLTPEMFSGDNNQDKYSTIMDLFGATKNDEKISDAMAVLVALSQTNKSFRAALDQIPEPENNDANLGSLTNFLTKSTAYMVRNLVGSIDTNKSDAKELLDTLSQNLIQDKHEANFKGLRKTMEVVSKADDYIKGALVTASDTILEKNATIQESDRKALTKLVSNSVALAGSFLSDKNTDIAFEGIKEVTHMGQNFDKFVPIQEFVSNLVGTDRFNKNVVALLDRTNRAVSFVRQAYREELPVLFQNSFDKKLSKAEWKALHVGLGQTDFAKLYNINRKRESMRLLTQDAFLNRNIEDREKAIKSAYSRTVANSILVKSQQLADFMNNKGAGLLLQRNAYAINKLSGNYNESMTETIDELVSLYAIEGTELSQRELLAELIEDNSQAVQDMIVYTQALNAEEDNKIISEEARINGYKGYIPNQGNGITKVIIEKDEKRKRLEQLGYTRIGDYFVNGDTSLIARGYYVTTIPQEGRYTQGVLQNVHNSYRGVDATTGLSINSTTSSIIAGNYVKTVNRNLNNLKDVKDPKETLLPIFDNKGKVQYFERAINPDIVERYTEPSNNMALMLGAWAGRQVEEKFAQRYNNELINTLKTIYDEADLGTNNLFVNIADPTIEDKIYKDSWNIIPTQTKRYIESVFGEGEFWIKKDMINMAVGYREPTILDVWTGKSRLPKAVQNGIQVASKTLLGDYATRVLSTLERGTQSIISTAKDIIVVRSMVVPYMNTQANVFQLNTRGVGTKDIFRGYREKFSEIETYNNNVRKIIQLENQQRLSLRNTNAVRVLKGQIQTIRDENKRMSIAPMIEAGAYKNISEGMTELDIELTGNNLTKWFDKQTDKLPPAIKKAGKYAVISKDTQLYKMADKAVQYGDFLAKSIYYDHLVNRQGMNKKEAIDIVNEEFVNFSVPLGRTHSYLESLGVLWFQTFKIKITKIAFSIMRNHPVRALLTANTVGDLGSPVNDNLINVIREDRLDYSVGWEMLMGSPELNPWVNLYNLN